VKRFVDPDIISRVATDILGTNSNPQDLKKK
jgi:hypothetical protein